MNNQNKALLARARGAMPRFLALTQLLRREVIDVPVATARIEALRSARQRKDLR